MDTPWEFYTLTRRDIETEKEKKYILYFLLWVENYGSHCYYYFCEQNADRISVLKCSFDPFICTHFFFPLIFNRDKFKMKR